MIVDSVFNKWNINKLPRQKGAQGNYGGSTVINRNENNVQNTGIEGHYLWGNYFDATQDINGDINTQGDVNFYGNLNYQGEYNPDDELHGNLNIGRVNAEDGNIKNINSDLIKAAEAYIENLTVTGSAHFFELIIDKIRSVGGAIMLTPADGFELYGYNIKTSDQINLWWVKTDDRNGKYNHWEVGDQALCRNFDAAVVGKSYNVQNKYWWAKVVDVNTTGQWVVKLYDNQYNRDEVMVLPTGNSNAYYNNTHGYLKKSDFQLTTDYVYVETAQKNHWITNEEYYRLDDNEKAEYEFSQLYVHENGDGSVIKITELQYQNTDIDEVDLLIYDEIAYDWKLLRSFCKADCKFCYNITIDKSISATGSTFSVTESGNTAWVFQEGDNIVMLGNQTDTNRQNAIYLNAGGQGDSLDTDLRPPFFAQYKGINDFNLKNHRLTWFSGGFVGTQGSAGYPYANNIQGNLRISSTDPNIDGENVQDYVNSQITVAEDRITAEVTENVNGELERTGIDIENGTITLDAEKTMVTGELSLINPNSGFVLYDNNHNPAISIQNIPVGDASTASYTIYGDDELSGSRTTNSVHLYIKSSTIGLINGSYSVDNMKLLTYIYDDNPDNWNITNVTANGYIYKSDNTSYKTLFTNKTVSGTSSSKYVDLGGPYTFTSDYTGDCYVYLDVIINFSTTITGRLFGGQTITKITSVTNKIMKIGSDGVIFITDPNQYAMFNSTKFEFKHGTNVLNVDNNGIQRTIGSSTADIGSIVPTKIIDVSSSPWPTIIGGWYGFVVYTGSYTGVSYANDEIEDPASDNIGARYIFKNLSNLDIYLHTNNYDTIIHPDETTPRTGQYDSGWDKDKTYKLDVGEIITMISDGTHWNIFSGSVN